MSSPQWIRPSVNEYERLQERLSAALKSLADAEAKLAEWKDGAVNDACGDALELLWRDVIIAHKPDYGPWEYPGQAYRHLLAEFNDLKAKLADERKLADELADKLSILALGRINRTEVTAHFARRNAEKEDKNA